MAESMGGPTLGQLNTAQPAQVIGNIAAGATDSGNPVKVGGVYHVTLPTLTDGQRGDIQLDNRSIQMINNAYALSASIDSVNIGDGTNTINVSAVASKNGFYVTSQNPTGSAVPANAFYIGVNNGSNLSGLVAPFNGDGTNATGAGIAVGGYMFNGSTWDRLRIPSKFFTITATASGDNAIWTPTSGKKFRLMGWSLQATAEVAISGGAADLDVIFRDGTTAIGQGASFYIPQTGATSSQIDDFTGWHMLGNGYLSTAANNVLNLNLSTTLTSGKVRVNVCGTEE